ncbi:MAG: hypothetical protein KFH87_07850, partial [Bacteroidetes bacterium]|nr:hypothetical protein [Bacteroidota bacterium]
MPIRSSLLFSTVFALLLVACSSESGETLKSTPPAVKLFNVEQARIDYTYGGAASGKKTHIIANYGMYQKMVDEMSFTIDGRTQEVHRMDIISGNTLYDIDMRTQEGTRTPYDTMRIIEMTRDFSDEELKDFQASYLLRSQGEKVGKDTVLGKICDVYSMPMMGMRMSVWKGLTLRSQILMGDEELTMTATKLETDFRPTVEMFQPPKDIIISEPSEIEGLPPGHPPVDGN